MGLIWEKLWKQTEVAGKVAKFAAAQLAGHNFAAAQWPGLLFRHAVSGKSLGRQARLPAPCCIGLWTIFGQVWGPQMR